MLLNVGSKSRIFTLIMLVSFLILTISTPPYIPSGNKEKQSKQTNRKMIDLSRDSDRNPTLAPDQLQAQLRLRNFRRMTVNMKQNDAVSSHKSKPRNLDVKGSSPRAIALPEPKQRPSEAQGRVGLGPFFQIEILSKTDPVVWAGHALKVSVADIPSDPPGTTTQAPSMGYHHHRHNLFLNA